MGKGVGCLAWQCDEEELQAFDAGLVKDEHGRVVSNKDAFEHPYFAELKRERIYRHKHKLRNLKHLRRADQVQWALGRMKNPGAHLHLDQIKNLEHWFHLIDADDSGEVSLFELADPLLTTGLANSISECVEIFSTIDEDRSGEICLTEFLELVTVKSSGRLERERRRRVKLSDQDKGWNVAAIPAHEKTNGILAVLEQLKNDKHNSLSLNTAVGIERRKFLLKAVMPKLKGIKLRVDSKKFKALQGLLFSAPEHKRKTLDVAATAHYCFPKHHGGGFASEPAPRKNAFDVFADKPDMPWRNRKHAELARKKEKSHVERCARFAWRFDHVSSIDHQRRSKALPKVRHVPPTQVTHSRSSHRVVYSSDLHGTEKMAYSQLERANEACLQAATSQVPIGKSNMGVHCPAIERTMVKFDVRQFIDEFFATREEDKFYKEKFEKKNVFLKSAIRKQARKQGRVAERCG